MDGIEAKVTYVVEFGDEIEKGSGIVADIDAVIVARERADMELVNEEFVEGWGIDGRAI
ncbi:hypothetical protein [Edaphobacter aggregans]|uniref:hypothetical protein n=1 Tax=Edaphobacter aggregans TaxID=570835 RepID=UPI0021AE1B15|nr:hypothetical protein [Edaphobacter aggregans]